jgi:hypothetical protein
MKHSKCAFGCSKVAYLSHVVSVAKVAMDQQKVQAILDWLTPSSMRMVHSFLGLEGYYHRFTRDYCTTIVPLTKLLHKGAFRWCTKAEDAFHALQHALTITLAIQLPDLDKLFMVECDVFGSGFGVILHQGMRSMAFFNRPIAACHAKLEAYECELIGLVHAVHHWRPYLWGCTFVIKTNHYSLNFLIDQRLPTIPQYHWASKLLGFNFQVEYKPGETNVVADALSHHDTESATTMAILSPSFQLFDNLRRDINDDLDFHAMCDNATAGTCGNDWHITDGLVIVAGRIYLRPPP